MNILLLGSGGREHTLSWKISQSSLCTQLFIAPGNAGTLQYGTNIDLLPTDFEGLKKFALTNKIEMLVVGPEEPLVKGIVDFFANDPDTASIPVLGPSAKAAQLEGSKAFSKKFMERHGIPTAAYHEFNLNNYAEGIDYLRKHELPIVLKADGLAAGKGVVICQSYVEAMAEYELMLQHDKFGEAGRKIVVEEFLTGIELSVFVLTDGKNYLLLPEAKDYKRIGEGDTGANTGGMGAVSPVPFASKDFMKKIEERIIKPTIAGLRKDEIDYKGFIFIGVIKVGDDPFVIEYNCRLGDPETEVILPRLKNDLIELFQKTFQQRLNEVKIEIDSRFAGTIMAVSGGYPGSYEKGFEIKGMNSNFLEDSFIFQAGAVLKDGKIITNGGRVFCVTSFADSIYEAVGKSREIMEMLDFESMYYRRDIGYEFIEDSE
jgi:phosphoribosylamine---glycine ligase